MQTESYKGMTIEIHQDETPDNPRDWDNLGTMVCWHRRYNLGDEHHFRDPDDFFEFIKEEHNGRVIILNVYMYDHSGITINTSGFSCPWDSGQIGYIYVTYEDAMINVMWNWKYMTKKRIKYIEDILRNEIETYDQYLTGDVWGFVIKGMDDESFDSCWGFFGYDHCVESAREVIDNYLEAQRKEAIRVRQITQLCCSP